VVSWTHVQHSEYVRILLYCVHNDVLHDCRVRFPLLLNSVTTSVLVLTSDML